MRPQTGGETLGHPRLVADLHRRVALRVRRQKLPLREVLGVKHARPFLVRPATGAQTDRMHAVGPRFAYFTLPGDRLLQSSGGSWHALRDPARLEWTSMAESLSGIIERITFHNAENGFVVLRVQVPGRRDLVT